MKKALLVIVAAGMISVFAGTAQAQPSQNIRSVDWAALNIGWANNNVLDIDISRYYVPDRPWRGMDREEIQWARERNNLVKLAERQRNKLLKTLATAAEQTADLKETLQQLEETNPK
jgi:hypothetical protein